MKNKNILINSSNLHHGGGVQVAASFIYELSLNADLPNNIFIWASKSVDLNLRLAGCNFNNLPNYEVVNSNGISLLFSYLSVKLNSFNAVFTIFGPLYVFRLRGINITGFAQAWVLYPDNDTNRVMGLKDRVFTRFKYLVQSTFFRRADSLVVELEHVRTGLLAKGIGSVTSIDVVRNSLSGIYTKPTSWQSCDLPIAEAAIKLGFVGRNYVHKNTRIFPDVVNALQRLHGIRVSIYVTFTEEEWSSCDKAFRAVVVNVGPLYITQCPTFYSNMDAIIFPSLLECFSATPLEAMAMKKPLFASNRPFNRDVCNEHAHYFDPLSPESAADAIARVFKQGGPSSEALEAAREHALNFSNPKERAEKYLAILMQCLQDKKKSKQ